MKAPVSSFVAIGVVASSAKHQDNPRKSWYGHHLAAIKSVRMLTRNAALGKMKAALPKWGWLSQPRRSTSVPVSSARKFVEVFDCVATRANVGADGSALEGIKTEEKVLRRYRSQHLRNLALEKAAGNCSACRRDFKAILDGAGCRVLQVHHIKQLAASDEARITRLRDLAVVCANCHLLIHANPKRALSVGTTVGSSQMKRLSHNPFGVERD
jgi:predicted HNH restriction endonuclease